MPPFSSRKSYVDSFYKVVGLATQLTKRRTERRRERVRESLQKSEEPSSITFINCALMPLNTATSDCGKINQDSVPSYSLNCVPSHCRRLLLCSLAMLLLVKVVQTENLCDPGPLVVVAMIYPSLRVTRSSHLGQNI